MEMSLHFSDIMLQQKKTNKNQNKTKKKKEKNNHELGEHCSPISV